MLMTYGPWVVGVVILIVIYSDRKALRAWRGGYEKGDEAGYNRAAVHYEQELRRLGAPSSMLRLLNDNVTQAYSKDLVITHKSNLKGQR